MSKLMKLKFISILTFALVTGAVAQTETPKPMTVGILAIAGPRRTLANNIVSLLTVNLSSDARFVIVDRSELDKVLAEQELGRSGNITPDTAAKIGQLTGAKVLVTGREFNALDTGDGLVVIANVIGTETGRVFSKTVQGSRTNLVELIAGLSQQVAQTIAEQSTNFIAGAPASREERIAELLKKITGEKRPAVSVKINEQMPDGSIAHQTAETEFGLLLQKAGFTVVDDKSNKKADVIVTGDAILADSPKVGKKFVSGHAILEIKAQQRTTGKILSLDRQEGIAVDMSEGIAAKQALQIATDDLAERLLPLLAQ
jgi:Curli production assembly/transport component CsgG